jgi:hypothetical protein
LNHLGFAMLIAGLGSPTSSSAEGSAARYNDGTDPAQPAQTASLSYEHRRLADGDLEASLFADFTVPLASDRTVFAVRLPFVSLNASRSGFGLGDVGVSLSQILPTGSKGAVILGAQLEFDSASQPERGTGQTVATASMIIERILPGGIIVAPTFAHSLGVSGSDGRINFSRFNLYIVPVVGSERLYLTFDPALTVDWGEGTEYADVAVTLGYGLGRRMGGDTQIFARPTIGLGKARTFDWAIEVGFQLLNF